MDDALTSGVEQSTADDAIEKITDARVLISCRRYKISVYLQNDGEICLGSVQNCRHLRISYDDIVAIKIIIGDIEKRIEKCSNQQFCLTIFSVFKNKRRFGRIILTVDDYDIAKRVCDYILKKTAAQRPPHLSPAVSRSRRRILVLINPFSGRKRATKLWKKYVIPILEIAHIDYELIRTAHERHAVEIAKDLELDEYDAIAVISGDGLVLEVITGFLSRNDRERALKMPLAHIPGGTSNGLAASICFQCNEPFEPRGVFCREMALMIVQPRYLPLRISHAQTEHDGDKAMFMSLTWGLIADIDIGSERFRWAGMARLHIEAALRIAELPRVAHYKARISYIPVHDDALKNNSQLRYDLQREKYTKGHFDYAPVEDFTDYAPEEASCCSSDDIFEDADLVKMPPLSEPVGSEWVTLEGYFVYVCLTSLSHLGSDVPYLPCARLDDEFLYLTYADWNGVKSRFEFAKMMLGIDDCSHLTYPFLQIIPVRACRVEPLDHCGGYVAVDGEPITSGSAFQVVPTTYCATVIGRNERR